MVKDIRQGTLIKACASLGEALLSQTCSYCDLRERQTGHSITLWDQPTFDHQRWLQWLALAEGRGFRIAESDWHQMQNDCPAVRQRLAAQLQPLAQFRMPSSPTTRYMASFTASVCSRIPNATAARMHSFRRVSRDLCVCMRTWAFQCKGGDESESRALHARLLFWLRCRVNYGSGWVMT